MDHFYLLQILIIFILILSLTSGRTLFYDESDSNDGTNLSSDEYEERQNSQSKQSNSFTNDNNISSKKREFHQRSIFPTSRTSSSQTRQQLIDLLRTAYNQGWKPNLKHYIPATRFGRHRR